MTIEYLLSSAIFTVSSGVYLLGSISSVIDDSNFYNITLLVGNLFYVCGYCAYIYECKTNSENPKSIPFITKRGGGMILPI